MADALRVRENNAVARSTSAAFSLSNVWAKVLQVVGEMARQWRLLFRGRLHTRA
ncbi:hypothetical protein ACTMU2_20710 [Cupriavidus basilensis]